MLSFQNMLLRKTMAVMIFTMAFLLTPKAFVGQEHEDQTSHIPVNMLQGPATQDCLWCTPATTPVDCKTKQNKATPARDNKLWLNPDQPITPPESAPCIDAPEEDDTTPSA